MILLDDIHKKMYTHRALNLITFFFATFFIFYAVLICVVQSTKQSEYNSIYSQMVDDTLNFNTRLQSESANDGGGSSDTDDTPLLFNNAKSAVLFAWDKYENYNTFEMNSSSKIVSTAAGDTITMVASASACKFEDGSQYNSLISYEMPGTNYGKTKGTEFYYSNGKRYSRSTQSVTKNGDSLSASFSSAFSEDSNPVSTEFAFYVINSSTILKELNFEAKRSAMTNKLVCYYAGVDLNPNSATVNYRRFVGEQGGLSALQFSSVKAYLILDLEGNLVTLRVEEKYTAKYVGFVNVNITGVMTYNIKSFNEPVTITQPKV